MRQNGTRHLDVLPAAIRNEWDKKMHREFGGGFALDDAVAFMCYRGSEAHGTKLETTGLDDVDLGIVVIPPPNHQLGLCEFESVELHVTDPETGVHYDPLIITLRKLMRLLLNGNPNLHTWLWVDPVHVLHEEPAFAQVLQHRAELVSKHMLKAFLGYAHGQLKNAQQPKRHGYQSAEREAAFQQLGYDAKAAAHAVRTLYMAGETLETGRLNVWRPERRGYDFIMDVKRGGVSWAEVVGACAALESQAELAHAGSRLRGTPDPVPAEQHLIDATLSFWLEKGWLERWLPQD